MLPAAYHVPAAVLLLGGGLLACFVGHRLFRVVLGIYGFVTGALLTTRGGGRRRSEDGAAGHAGRRPGRRADPHPGVFRRRRAGRRRRSARSLVH